MIRRSFTAVLERNVSFTADFATEPYEAGWATEARWFVHVLEMRGVLHVTPQISPDGLTWCDEGHLGARIEDAGLYSFPLRDFGHWLRVTGWLSGENHSAKVVIYLALKGVAET